MQVHWRYLTTLLHAHVVEKRSAATYSTTCTSTSTDCMCMPAAAKWFVSNNVVMQPGPWVSSGALWQLDMPTTMKLLHLTFSTRASLLLRTKRLQPSCARHHK